MSAPLGGAIQWSIRGVRRGLLSVFIAFGLGASLTWYFRETVFELLLAPANGALSPYGVPVFTSPTEMLSATIRLTMMGGVVTAFPVLAFTVFRLLSPLLTRQHRQFAAIFLPSMFLCYLGGAAFAYFVMLPVGLKFLLHFGEGVATPMIRLSEYMSLITTMVFWLGVVFELPLAMFLLAKLRLVSHERLRRLRRYVPAAAFVLGAIITPTFDIINQTMVAVPIIMLYEAGLFLAWLARPKEEGHRTMTQIAKALAGGTLRRVAVIVVTPLALVLGLIYVIALCVVFVWDGHLSTEAQSKGKVWLDGAYGRARGVVARVVCLRN